ncbi:bifunctional protein-serine/threonine kinase/phosphatase [Aestuariicella hydrocarbonica]|uniref:Bifunctional protein-serine/threonine kinase/phosphatase n=1 Tax=Pseudomaricurvus hydrocarbonicus TaxID=1470433 RepID=A0A9E5T461_9GAMM|nr:bifunctional protein-serine/threonine kinase/phosphatase [Aestuariicella hydrocarbonica]NHO67594.1 bifunctional protein-serine/threonine kinase/phosphatase [Aestuariicella hydrocarbonica]
MPETLRLSLGQYSDKGRKPSNQDFIGATVPENSQLDFKGAALAMADGISSSDVSHIASETAVKNFLDDYYCTSDAWSVKKSVYKVLEATNAWLYSQSQNSPMRYEKDKGYVCTLSALVIKCNTAHVFHAGDTRVYRLNDHGLEQLTHDHRRWISEDQSYLSRALGVDHQCEFDYQSLTVNIGDVFILATDGVYEFIEPSELVQCIGEHRADLNRAARVLVESAYQQGSTDNLSLQLVRVDALPCGKITALKHQAEQLPFPPQLEENHCFDGYTILRQLHASSRSHVYLARDQVSDSQVIIKTPSIDLRGDPDYLERFLTEEWIARRIHSQYVLKAGRQQRTRNYLYTVTEYIKGQTLAQWLRDNPQPNVEEVRNIIEQVAKGLMAFHRMEMLHQDLKPDNVMIDQNGTVKIIDFGSTRVAGLVEVMPEQAQDHLLGTALYTAPEYFLGEAGTPRSEQFSLGVLAYHMLSGRFPYGNKVSQSRTVRAQRNLVYQSVLDVDREIPAWIDDTLKKALHPSPHKRYDEMSEFLYDLRHPNKAFLNKSRAPLLERNPVAFWQGMSFILASIIVLMLFQS